MEPKTFVVPLDGSELAERAVPVAAALARRIGGRVLVVTAEFGSSTVHPREYLDEIASRDLDCAIEPMFVVGKYPATVLAELLAEHDDYVVCMTTHGRGRVAWAAIGSVAETVLREAKRPLVLVGPHCRPDFFMQPGRMLVACAGEPWAADAADDVRSWATRLELEPHVVTVAHPLDTETTVHPERITQSVARQFGVEPNEVVLVHDDDPQAVLLRKAGTLGASMIAMATHSRHGLARVALGSVTTAVVRHAPCPVLALPRAFGAKEK